jgi:hypothetical protein
MSKQTDKRRHNEILSFRRRGRQSRPTAAGQWLPPLTLLPAPCSWSEASRRDKHHYPGCQGGPAWVVTIVRVEISYRNVALSCNLSK